MKIEAKDILSFNFYTYKQPFTGSCQGMRYRIVRAEVEDTDAVAEQNVDGVTEEPEKPKTKLVFQVHIWHEPFAFDCTPAEEMETNQFPFDPDGYEQVVAWLNEKLPEYTKPRW